VTAIVTVVVLVKMTVTMSVAVAVTMTLTWLSTETSSMSTVRRQGDGKHLHRGAEILRQSTDGEPRERSSDEGRWQRLQVLPQQVQTI